MTVASGRTPRLPTGKYARADLEAMFIASFKKGDFAVFTYPPQRYERWKGHNDTTDLILDFKSGVPDAGQIVAAWAIEGVESNLARFRDSLQCRLVVAAPRSEAALLNGPCEALAQQLAARFPWLTYLPRALERITSVPKAAKGGPRDPDLHAASIRFVAPKPQSDLVCPCGRRFGSLKNFQYHCSWKHPDLAGAKPTEIRGANALLVDDVTTSGATVEGCRRVLKAAGVGSVAGFLVGRTG
jgi:hypothetical protein